MTHTPSPGVGMGIDYETTRKSGSIQPSYQLMYYSLRHTFHSFRYGANYFLRLAASNIGHICFLQVFLNSPAGNFNV